MADSVHGFDCAPDRYMTTGREACDVIRDRLGDDGFVAFCQGNVLKYKLRVKGAPGHDARKADWYEQMAAHVTNPDTVPDPRAQRPGFVPYRRVVPPGELED